MQCEMYLKYDRTTQQAEVKEVPLTYSICPRDISYVRLEYSNYSLWMT